MTLLFQVLTIAAMVILLIFLLLGILLVWPELTNWLRNLPGRPGDYLTLPVLLAILWVIFISFGFGWIKTECKARATPVVKGPCLPTAEKNALPHGLALRPMPVNWRIGNGDISWPEQQLNGKYLKCAVAASELVVLQEVGNGPELSPSPGKVTHRLMLDPASTPNRDLNAGMRVQIFEGEGPALVPSAGVLVVIGDPVMAAIFEVSPEESRLLERPKNKLIIVGKSPAMSHR
jgi:hypothetical protein